MSGASLQAAEGVILTTLVVGGVLWWLVRRLARSRPDLRIGGPIAIGFGLRLAAIAGIGLTGLGTTLRGGDETTFLDFAHYLAHQPFGRGCFPTASTSSMSCCSRSRTGSG